MAEFDFKELTARAFDYVGPNFPIWWARNKDKFSLPDLMDITGGLLLGKKFFTTLTLLHDGEKITLPNEPLLSISQSKTIVETATVGKHRQGKVKEYINTEDYAITIRGLCIDPENTERYPSEQVARINRLFAINDSLEVVGNKFFELFGIRNIVLREKSFDEMAGKQGMQKYILRASSDMDFYADLTERAKFLS
jgi:hypothetical protein